MDILIVFEENNGKIHRMGFESITAAQQLSGDLGLSTGGLVMGANADALADQASAYDVGEVIKVSDPLLDV